jgi:predicted Zn-dependent peptidase
MESARDFACYTSTGGVCFHLNYAEQYKTIRVDLCLSERLRENRHTRLALISRLLERGTRHLPDIQSLNRFIDDLYGAHYFAEVDRLGEYQLIHLCLEVVDEQYLGGEGRGILRRGCEFLRQVLVEPAGDGQRFHPDYLEQEKRSLLRQIAGNFNDKLGYAQHRCVEEMCRGESIALSHLGDPEEIAEINAGELLDFHRDFFAECRIDIFVSGPIEAEQILPLLTELFGRRAHSVAADPPVEPSFLPTREREVFEWQDVQQAKLVLGYRTEVAFGDPGYAALILLNSILGGEGQSRLFRHLREEEGLCYYVSSQLEPLSRLLFIVAGIESDAYRHAKMQVGEQLDRLKREEVEGGELEAARHLLKSRLLGLGEDREALYRFYLRGALTGNTRTPVQLWREIEKVGVADLLGIARGLALDTSYLLHGELRAKEAV